MKKTGFLSIFLCLLLALQLFSVPAYATESTPPPTQTQPPTETTEGTIPESSAAFGSVSILNGCRTLDGMVSLMGGEYTCETARGVFVYEKNTGTVVYSYNPDLKMSPGTLIKVVTALVAIENCRLDEVVTAREAIQSRVPGSAQRMSPQLKSGEQMTVEDLLHSLLLDSSNDAAVALAEHVAGTTEAYKQMMNERVKKMGCQTRFIRKHCGFWQRRNVEQSVIVLRISNNSKRICGNFNQTAEGSFAAAFLGCFQIFTLNCAKLINLCR